MPSTYGSKQDPASWCAFKLTHHIKIYSVVTKMRYRVNIFNLIKNLFSFSGGSICSPFFSLVLTYRGLKLTEFSSVFSMIFLVQLLLAYFSGIIADKLGNAKPVLLFQTFGTVAIVIGLLLAPDVRDKACLELDMNATCFSDFSNATNLDHCRLVCSTNNSYNFLDKYAYESNNVTITSTKRTDKSTTQT